jgi:predicted O-methyltransferase YrrM
VSAPAFPRIGHERIDAYLTDGYLAVRGMSARFAGAVAAGAMQAQSEAGLAGHVFEIGCFEGRFTIAMALGLTGLEQCFAVDSFTWPGEHTFTNFERNWRKRGVVPERMVTLKTDVRDLDAATLAADMGDLRVRFAHVDGDHRDTHLSADLDLTLSLMDPRGLICLDDMLHPLYPDLALTVARFRAENPDWRVVCVIDRESLSAAAKFLMCRVELVEFYEAALKERFADHAVFMRADFVDYTALVLAPDPTLPHFD